MKRECSDEVELKSGRALPGGWSQYEVWHNEERIGWIENGYPDIKAEGYSFELSPEGDNTRCRIFVETGEDVIV